MTAPARFKQDDLTRAVRGLANAGMRVGRVEIEPSGKIVILSDAIAPVGKPNAWDTELTNG